VLTAAGERLELTRLLRIAPRLHPRDDDASRRARVDAVCARGGIRIIGVAFIALALWLCLFDIARRTVRISGLPRFIAVALLSGYAWLGVAGLLAVRWGPVAAGLSYDAMLHAVFVGFVFSMIFGHAPIIVPAVLGRRLIYRPRFYVHLGGLHVTGLLQPECRFDLGSCAPEPRVSKEEAP
jgi:hypothetical protein